MIKGYKFLVSEEEKSRILNLHQNSTRSQYLNISEQDNDETDPTRKEKRQQRRQARQTQRNQTKVERQKELEKQENEKLQVPTSSTGDIPPDNTNTNTGANPPDNTNTNTGAESPKKFQIWSMDDDAGIPRPDTTTTSPSDNQSEIEKNQEDKKEEDKKEESSPVTINPEDKKTLEFKFTNETSSPPFSYMNGSELSYNTHYNKDKDGKYNGDIYRIDIFDSDLTTEEKNVSLYVYGKPQDSVPDPTEIKFNPNDKEFIKFQNLLNQTKTKEEWDKLVKDSLDGVTPTITTNSESNSQTTQTKTEFVLPKTHSEGVSQITEKLKSLGYDTTNIGTAVLQFLEKNKPS